MSEAAECLSDMLRGGPKLKSEIISETKEMGISWSAVRRAQRKLGVQSRKRAGQRYGHFEWFLEGCEDGEITPS